MTDFTFDPRMTALLDIDMQARGRHWTFGRNAPRTR
jgi:hypothetical protein